MEAARKRLLCLRGRHVCFVLISIFVVLVSPLTIAKVTGSTDVEQLLKALRHEDSRVRSFAAKSLGEIGDPRAIEPLIAALKDKNLWVRWTMVKALSRFNDHRTIDPLIEIIEKTRKETKRYGSFSGVPDYIVSSALGGLANITDSRAVDKLLEVIFDENKYKRIRESALHSLLKANRSKGIDAAKRLLNSKNLWIKGKSACLLALEGYLPANDVLISLLGNNDYVGYYVLCDAADTLGRLQDKRAVKPLMLLLEKYKSIIKARRARIDKMEIKPGVMPLNWIDTEKGVLVKSIATLATLNAAEAVDNIMDLLEDRDKMIRESAVRYMGKVRVIPAIEPLIERLESDISTGVRYRSLEALKSITGQDFGPNAGAWRKWWKKNKKALTVRC